LEDAPLSATVSKKKKKRKRSDAALPCLVFPLTADDLDETASTMRVNTHLATAEDDDDDEESEGNNNCCSININS